MLFLEEEVVSASLTAPNATKELLAERAWNKASGVDSYSVCPTVMRTTS